MPTLKIATFNIENLLDRFQFRDHEKPRLATLLDVGSEEERTRLIRNYWNILTDEKRVFTALTLREEDPEVICLQEVESLKVMKWFHDNYLRRYTGRNYEHQVLIEGNDPRGIDVCVLSRYKIVKVVTHQERVAAIATPDGDVTERVFRRDCLEVHIKKQNRILPIFVCHFKSMFGGRMETRPTRYAEAREVRRIIEESFPSPADADWVVAGDLNDYTETDGVPDASHGLQPLLEDGFSHDLVKRISEPKDRWTHYYATENSYHQLDYILLSPNLAANNPNTIPKIIRNGQPYRAERYQGERWPRIGFDRPKASDHSPVFAEIEF